MMKLTPAIDDTLPSQVCALVASRRTTRKAMLRNLPAHEAEQENRIAPAHKFSIRKTSSMTRTVVTSASSLPS